MTSIYPKKQVPGNLKPMCLDEPPDKRILSRRQSAILSILFILLIFSLRPIAPPFQAPPEPPPIQESPNFGLPPIPSNLQQSNLIPSKIVVFDLIETTDNGFAILCEESSFGNVISLMLLKTNQSGDLQWSRSYGFNDWRSHSCHSVVQTQDGGYAITGSYNGIESSSDGSSSIGYSEFWVIKTDENGSVQWRKTYYRDNMREIGLFSLIPTSDGGLIVGGYTSSWETWTYWWIDRKVTGTTWIIKLDPEGAVQWNQVLFSKNEWIFDTDFLVQTMNRELIYAHSENRSIGIMKLDEAGIIEWSYQYGGTHEQITLRSLQVTSNEEFLLGYKCELQPGGGAYITENFGIARIAPDGKLILRKTYDLPTIMGSLWDSENDRYFYYTDPPFIFTDDNNFLVAFERWDGDLASYIVKFSEGGERIWTQLLENIGLAPFVTAVDGNYVFSATNYLVSNHASLIMMKYDENGTILWLKNHSIPADDEWASSFIQTSSGDLAISGYTNSVGNGKADGFLVLERSFNEFKWSKTYGGNGDDGLETLIQTVDGGFALGGVTNSYGAGGFDMWLIKTDSQGGVLWNQTYGGVGNEWCESIVQTQDLGYILAGSSVSMDSGLSEVFIVKTDKNGGIEWNQTFGSNQSEKSSIHASIILQNNEGDYTLGISTTRAADGAAVGLVKLKKTGEILWTCMYNSSIGGEEYRKIGGLTLDEDGYSLLGESFTHCGEWCHPDAGNTLFLLKIDDTGQLQWNQSYSSYRSLRSDRSGYFGGYYKIYLDDSFSRMKHAFSRTPEGGYIIGYENWLIKTDSNGEVEWNTTISIPPFGSDLAMSCAIQTKSEELTIAGSITTTFIDTGSSLDIWFAHIDLQNKSQSQYTLGFTGGNIPEKAYNGLDNLSINDRTSPSSSILAPSYNRDIVPGFDFVVLLLPLFLSIINSRKRILIVVIRRK